MNKTFGLIACILTLSACNEIPGAAYYNRGDPENLIDASTEIIHVGLTTPGSLNDLALMVRNDPPTRAELACGPSDALCTQAKGILERQGVPVQWKSGTDGLSMVYERVRARDCENRYIDNSVNPYNLNPPTFGCSVAGNTVQMVSDKRQFINPNLLDFPDGEKTVQDYRRYEQAPPPTEAPSRSGSLINVINQ